MKRPNPNRNLRDDQRGNVAMILAIALVPILIVVGFAVDSQLAFSKKGKIQHASDSAALAGARMMQNTTSEAEVKLHARNYFEAMMASESSLTCDTLDVKFTGPEEIEVVSTCRQPTTLTRLIGRDYVQLSTSSVATYGTGRLDVAFVFDISGSMKSYGRIYDLKTAAKDAVETLLPEPGSASDGDVRIAMVSYNDMIDAGKYFENVTGMKARRTYRKEINYTEQEPYEVEVTGYYTDCEYVCYFSYRGNCIYGRDVCSQKYGKHTETRQRDVERTKIEEKVVNSSCVWERDGVHAFDNSQPLQLKSNKVLSIVESGKENASETSKNEEGYMAAQAATWKQTGSDPRDGYWQVDSSGDNCSDIEPFGLSHNKTQINSYIDSLYADGGTAGHQGIEWGWYLISDTWGDVFTGQNKPLDKTEPDLVKAMIVMTDGEFLNQKFGSLGNSTKQAEKACDAIKDDDVIIYTVAFQAPQKGKDILSYCASGPEFFFSAENGQELVESYRAIATSISDLRISH